MSAGMRNQMLSICAFGLAVTVWQAAAWAETVPAKDPKTRRWNPLGFKIIDFRSEPEVLVEQPATKELRHEQ